MSFGISPSDLERFIHYCIQVRSWCSSETVNEYNHLRDSANFIESLKDKIRLAYSSPGRHQPAVEPLLKRLDEARKEIQGLLQRYHLNDDSSLAERLRFSTAAQKKLVDLMDRCKEDLERLRTYDGVSALAAEKYTKVLSNIATAKEKNREYVDVVWPKFSESLRRSRRPPESNRLKQKLNDTIKDLEHTSQTSPPRLDFPVEVYIQLLKGFYQFELLQQISGQAPAALIPESELYQLASRLFQCYEQLNMKFCGIKPPLEAIRELPSGHACFKSSGTRTISGIPAPAQNTYGSGDRDSLLTTLRGKNLALSSRSIVIKLYRTTNGDLKVTTIVSRSIRSGNTHRTDTNTTNTMYKRDSAWFAQLPRTEETRDTFNCLVNTGEQSDATQEFIFSKIEDFRKFQHAFTGVWEAYASTDSRLQSRVHAAIISIKRSKLKRYDRVLIHIWAKSKMQPDGDTSLRRSSTSSSLQSSPSTVSGYTASIASTSLSSVASRFALSSRTSTSSFAPPSPSKYRRLSIATASTTRSMSSVMSHAQSDGTIVQNVSSGIKVSIVIQLLPATSGVTLKVLQCSIDNQSFFHRTMCCNNERYGEDQKAITSESQLTCCLRLVLRSVSAHQYKNKDSEHVCISAGGVIAGKSKRQTIDYIAVDFVDHDSKRDFAKRLKEVCTKAGMETSRIGKIDFLPDKPVIRRQ